MYRGGSGGDSGGGGGGGGAAVLAAHTDNNADASTGVNVLLLVNSTVDTTSTCSISTGWTYECSLHNILQNFEMEDEGVR